jgi:RNA polymerase sigma-70 factor (ECF subfamily)
VPIINPGGDDEDNVDPVNFIVDHDPTRDPQAMLEHNETRRQLDYALAKLEPQFQLVLTLFFFEDLKYNDIADILNIPLNTVKSHIRRGKERLREIILEDSPDSALR